VSQRNSWPRHDEFFGTKLRTRWRIILRPRNAN